jgi:hypothetical protein
MGVAERVMWVCAIAIQVCKHCIYLAQASYKPTHIGGDNLLGNTLARDLLVPRAPFARLHSWPCG